MTRSFASFLLGLGLLVGFSAAPAAAQSSGAFAREYPEAARLLNGIHAAEAALIERLYTTPGITAGQVEGQAYSTLVDQIRQGQNDAVPSVARLMPRFAADAPAVAQLFDLTYALQREIYDVYADPRVSDKYSAAEAAIDRYLARSDIALSPTKKSMSAMEGNDMHAMHAMHGAPGDGFEALFPRTNGALWATNWLQLAIFDPLMYFGDAREQKAGVENVIARYRELIGSPDAAPQEMPTPAAVTPELVRDHPRAAALIHNMHMLQDEILTVLTNPAISDKRVGMNEAMTMFKDPEHMTVSDYDWIVFSLRNGIFYQGGPAIGRLERPERNASHVHVGTMPGMSAPSSAPPPQAPAGQGDHQH